MEYMFNQPLDTWNVSNVTQMSGMFHHATSFNQSLPHWDIGNVVDMDYMFTGASSFNQAFATPTAIARVPTKVKMFEGAAIAHRPSHNYNLRKRRKLSEP